MKLKHVLWITPLSVILIGLAIWFLVPRPDGAESENPSQKKPPPLVKAQPVRVSSIAATMELTGEVVASNSAVISAMKEGRIELCSWREGDSVESGETLVLIDREVHRTEAQAAQAALELAQARLEDLLAGTRPEEIRTAEALVTRSQVTLNEARQNFQRQSELFKQGITSQDTVDKAREQMEVAQAEWAAASHTLTNLETGPTVTEIAVQKATVNEAAARLDLAESHLAEFVITAPFSGTISKVHVRPGDVASPREPLVEMFDPASLLIRFTVPEAHATAVHTGMNLGISLDAAPGRSLSATVSRIHPALDPIMRTCTIEAVVAEPAELAPNMFARLTLQLAKVDDALVVPAEAVLVSPTGKPMLYVIEDGKAVQRPIATGIEDGVNVEVVSGVDAGEKVVVAGNELLKPGMPVRVAQGQEKSKKPGEQGAPTGSEKGNRQ